MKHLWTALVCLLLYIWAFHDPTYAQEATPSAMPASSSTPNPIVSRTPTPTLGLLLTSPQAATASSTAKEIEALLNTVLGDPFPATASAQTVVANSVPGTTATLEPALEVKRFRQSGRIKRPISIMKLRKAHYKATEPVKLTIDDADTDTTSLRVEITSTTENLPTPTLIQESEGVDGRTISISPTIKMKPGKYHLKVFDGDRLVTEQDFTWGVLAINPNKATYRPGETADIAMAVLDEAGEMVCDADVTLEIITPDGSKTEKSTKTGSIIVNPECEKKEFTLVPDYQTAEILQTVGRYGLMLTATTKNGTVSIRDGIEVREKVAFDIERKTATRIYPPERYPVTLRITPERDFTGTIVETVPQDFEIYPLEQHVSYDSVDIVSGATSDGLTRIQLRLPFEGEHLPTQGFGDDLKDPELVKKYQEFGLAAHDGVDFDLPPGTSVVAVDDGIVDHADWEPYGQTVIIQHRWGRSYYGHLSQFAVEKGASVKKGQLIGLSGNTGLSLGPHLHFSIRLNSFDMQNGYYGKINPMPYLTSDSAIVSDVAVKEIRWQVSLKAGQSTTLGYTFKAPHVSPEYYLLGPLKFLSTTTSRDGTQTPADNPFVLGDSVSASPSGEKLPLNGTKTLIQSGKPASQSSQLRVQEIIPSSSSAQTAATVSALVLGLSTSSEATSIDGIQNPEHSYEQLVFREGRQWQIAADAIVEMGDGLLVYDESDTSPVYRTYANTTNSFSGETNLTATVNPAQVKLKTSPTKYEAVALVRTTAAIYAYCFDGSSWSQDWSNTTATITDMDLAYEWHTGDVLAVFTDTAANRRIRYRTKPGYTGCGASNWGSETTFDFANFSAATLTFVKLSSDERAHSDLIAIGASISSVDELDFAIWSGTAFGNEPGALTEANMSNNYTHAFALGFERLSGDLLVTWGIEASSYRYRTCTGGTATCTWNAAANLGTTLQTVRNAVIASQPNSDILGISTLDATNDLETFYWDGSTPTRSALDGSCEAVATDATPTQQVATAFLELGGVVRKIVTYNDSNVTNIGWYVCDTSTCVLQTDIFKTNAPADPQRWMELEQDPKHLDRAMFLLSDTNSDLMVDRVVMSNAAPTFTWTESDGGADMEQSLSANTRQHFDFDYWQWAPIPNPEAIMRHGKWWNGHSRQVFTF